MHIRYTQKTIQTTTVCETTGIRTIYLYQDGKRADASDFEAADTKWFTYKELTTKIRFLPTLKILD